MIRNIMKIVAYLLWVLLTLLFVALMSGCHLHVHFDRHFHGQEQKADATQLIESIFEGDTYDEHHTPD